MIKCLYLVSAPGKFLHHNARLLFMKHSKPVIGFLIVPVIMETKKKLAWVSRKLLNKMFWLERNYLWHLNYGILSIELNMSNLHVEEHWVTWVLNIWTYILFISRSVWNMLTLRLDTHQNGSTMTWSKIHAWLRIPFQLLRPGEPCKN